MQLLVLGLLGQGRDRVGQVLPRLADQAAQHVGVGRAIGADEQPRLARRVDEAVEQHGVAVAAHRREQLVARLVALDAQAIEEAIGGLAIPTRQLRDAGFEALEEHVGVADGAERAAEPAELVAQRLGPGLVDEGAERPQMGPQATRRDAGLVHVLGVVPPADAGVVADEAGHGAAERARTTSATVWASSGGIPTSDGSAAHGPRARTIFGVGSGGPAPEARSRATIDAACASGAWSASSNSSSRNPVTEPSGPSTVTSSSTTSPIGVPSVVWSRTARRVVRSRATGRTDALRASARTSSSASVGGAPASPAERVRGPVEAPVGGARTRQLHRPALVVAVAQRRTGARQAQVVGVVVDREELLGVLGLGDDARQRVREGRQHARGWGGQLDLALDDGHVRGCARSTASSRSRTSASNPTSVSILCHTPSALSSQARTSSARQTVSSSSRRARNAGDSTGHNDSTRRSRLRGMRSADPIRYVAPVGSAPKR